MDASLSSGQLHHEDDSIDDSAVDAIEAAEMSVLGDLVSFLYAHMSVLITHHTTTMSYRRSSHHHRFHQVRGSYSKVGRYGRGMCCFNEIVVTYMNISYILDA